MQRAGEIKGTNSDGAVLIVGTKLTRKSVQTLGEGRPKSSPASEKTQGFIVIVRQPEPCNCPSFYIPKVPGPREGEKRDGPQQKKGFKKRRVKLSSYATPLQLRKSKAAGHKSTTNCLGLKRNFLW